MSKIRTVNNIQHIQAPTYKFTASYIDITFVNTAPLGGNNVLVNQFPVQPQSELTFSCNVGEIDISDYSITNNITASLYIFTRSYKDGI